MDDHPLIDEWDTASTEIQTQSCYHAPRTPSSDAYNHDTCVLNQQYYWDYRFLPRQGQTVQSFGCSKAACRDEDVRSQLKKISPT